QSAFFIGLERELYSTERAIIQEEKILASKGGEGRDDSAGVIINEKGVQSFQELNINFPEKGSVDLQEDGQPIIPSEGDPLQVKKEEEPLLQKRDIHISALKAIRTDFREHFLNQ